MDWITQPWPWYVAGPMIAFIMFLLYYVGRKFGLSSNLRTMCSIAGAQRFSDFFRFDWKLQIWNLVMAAGAVIGGFIAMFFLTPDESVAISEATVASLEELNIEKPGSSYLPEEMFGKQALTSPLGITMLIVGGFFVGFGARYAGGCTSGHAITGLSNFQWPSLLAVIGFFIGGLIMTWLILPHLIPAI